MPTIIDLGRLVKEKYPESAYGSMPDVEVGKLARDKFPDAYGSFTDSSQTPFQREAASRKASISVGQTAATYDQDVANAGGEAAGMVAAAIPMAVSVPLTGGLSLPAAIAASGLAGAAGGLASMGAKGAMGSTDLPMNIKDTAKRLAWDAATSALGEGAGRGLMVLGAKTLPAVIMRAAGKSNDGKAALDRLYVSGRGALDDVVAKHPDTLVDIAQEMRETIRKLTALPRGAGEMGEEFAGLSPKATEIMGKMVHDTTGVSITPGGGMASKQTLPALIEMKGNLNALAHDAGEQLSARESGILRELAAKLDGRTRATLKSLPKVDAKYATELYDAVQSVRRTQRESDVLVGGVERALSGVLGRIASGGASGAAVGYMYGGRDPAAVAAGGVAGAGLGLAGPAVARWAITAMAEHPGAAIQLKRATEFAASGRGAEADAAITRALGMAGIREHLKSLVPQEKK